MTPKLFNWFAGHTYLMYIAFTDLRVIIVGDVIYSFGFLLFEQASVALDEIEEAQIVAQRSYIYGGVGV